MTFICILGRQPELGLAELERLYEADNVNAVNDTIASVETDTIDVQRLGGSSKAGKIILRLRNSTWADVNKKVIQHYTHLWKAQEHKQTLGISVYDWDISPRDIQKLGLILKRRLASNGPTLRLIPNSDQTLSSATSHHNKLGLSANKTELLITKSKRGEIIIAESVGAQNITALATRDQGRPKRDAFVGMLPPKLALLMLNLAHPKKHARVLDPFCGTGVVLQEASLLGFDVYGTDLSEKMIDYSTQNLEWLTEKYHLETNTTIHQGDAMNTSWQSPIGAVVCETYLGQPFSAPPRPEKLTQVRKNCDYIIHEFLRNLAPQIKTGTPLCLAVPAWRDQDGRFAFLRIKDDLPSLGYELYDFKHAAHGRLLYFRPDQVVARELLVITRN